jgi:formate C-acetyltransferase
VVKYREKAKELGKTELYEALKVVPMEGAQDYYQATIVMRFLQYILRLDRHSHMTLGRYDQYMKPYYDASVAKGATYDDLLETTELFFISMNIDTDIYSGVQQGDNGQSLVLGGCDEDGNDAFNDLSEICLQASEDLKVIDPKINLRVNKNTPLSLYERGTRLTKQGLGFPQYSNDDVVIPGLIKLGYEPKDAYNYIVAACWEYIIPFCSADIPNKRTLNFPLAVSRAIRENLLSAESFDQLIECAKREISKACDENIASVWGYIERGGVKLSIFTDGCIESLTNLWQGGTKYKNFGSHGTGIANAADALAALKKLVFEEKSVTREELLDALEKDFEGYEPLRKRLLACPKMGNNDDYVDSIAGELMSHFGAYLNGKPNGLGGIWRAGTGSAMEYISAAKNCPATADGRHAGTPYGSSFSPSLEFHPDGLLSVIQSFTKHDMTDLINGGPLTLEIHDTVLRNDIGIKKTAALVKAFIDLGGHQLQLNSINRERLIDAREHPEKYPNLIVRVWGWSGRWNELGKEYQDHIIKRVEFSV